MTLLAAPPTTAAPTTVTATGPDRTLQRVALVMISVFGTLAATEWALATWWPVRLRRPWWHYDVLQRRTRGEPVVAYLGYANHHDLHTGMLCLSGLGETMTIGYPGPPAMSDRHGFNNPPGYYEAHPQFDAIAIGDSFVHGGQIVEALRDELGLTIYNAGYNSNGPLTELATLIEYGPPKRPRLVLWFVFEGNDVSHDIGWELRQPELARYLTDPMPQGLLAQADDRNRLLRTRLDEHYQRLLRDGALSDPEEFARWIRRTPRFQLAQRLSRLSFRTARGSLLKDAPPEHLHAFERVMQLAQETVARWSGQLIVVYLPEYRRFAHPKRYADELHQAILRCLDARGIEAIDLTPSFVTHAGVRQEWFLPDSIEPGEWKHYSDRGSEHVARVIAERLRSRAARMAAPTS